MIKQLEWKEDRDGDPIAQTPIGGYSITSFRGNIHLWFPERINPVVCKTIEEAKVEAQRHFEARVIKLIDIPAPLPQIAARFSYTNYKGEREEREVYPIGLFYGSTPYHPDQQWFLRVFDISRDAERDFALKDIG